MESSEQGNWFQPEKAPNYLSFRRLTLGHDSEISLENALEYQELVEANTGAIEFQLGQKD